MPGQALAFHPPLAARAVQVAIPAEVILHLEEQRPQLFPAPAGVAFGGPAVVVTGLAAHVDHPVDRRAAAEHLAARVLQRTAVEAGDFVGVEAPVGTRVADAIEVADGNVNPGVVVRATGFQQQDAVGRVGGKPVGQQAAGGTGADDEVVVGIQYLGHGEPRFVVVFEGCRTGGN
ncbi:hypothetical protein D3C80_1313670 [compost metagenome]